MDERYIRNFPAVSEEEFAALRTKKVLVVGCGGLGGYIIELLARLGIGSVRAVDGDCFELSNLNRQLLSAPGLIGQPKAEIAARRVADINPDVKVEAVHAWFAEDNAAKLMSGCDLVMDALDNIESRRILSKACEKAGLPLVHGAIVGWVAQAALSMPGDGFIDRLYPADVQLKDKSSLSFTPALCASMQCSLAVRLLAGRPVDGGVLYCFDILNMDFEAISLC